MNYTIPSKPTVYKNIEFRSRLEAQWAAFFDLINWRWVYEPFILNGWIPDFQVFGTEGRFIFFEIKPYLDKEVLEECAVKISRAAKIQCDTEFNIKPSCIVLSHEFKKCKEYNSVLAGYQIYMENSYFIVHWKDGQGPYLDIGSELNSFDGLLWNEQRYRKNFLYPDTKNHLLLLDNWLEAGKLSTFHPLNSY